MTQNRSGLRFDHREIAVVFSLFVFVALLMFTVGILVGKGIAQSKYEKSLAKVEPEMQPESTAQNGDEEAAPLKETAETDPSNDMAPESDGPSKEMAGQEDQKNAKDGATKLAESATEPAKESDKFKEIELIPLGTPKTSWNGTGLRNLAKTEDSSKLLSNPRIRALTEKAPSRETAAVPKDLATPKDEWSYPQGPFTVQVGSYPNQKDADERVKTLKSLGFAHAYFSAKDLGGSEGTWYRVWLGYYPNYESAKKSGDRLQARGEVRNYLVRKAELEHGTR